MVAILQIAAGNSGLHNVRISAHAKQESFVQGMLDFPLLPGIVQVLEII
jgi:hypothetical protein